MWFDPITIWLLRSPLHGVMSKSTMLITCTGRKSGKSYTTPVNYWRMSDEGGEYLLTTSYRRRTWWRNLRGVAPVSLHLQGRDLPARAEAFEDPQVVTAEVSAFLSQNPRLARYYKVGLDEDGRPNAADLAKAAEPLVVIHTRLNE
jgi:hypothetical protein